MRVENTLRVAGRAGSVAETRRRVFVELRPGKVVISLRHQILERHDVAQGRLRHVRLVREDDECLDHVDLLRKLLEDRNKGQVDEDHPVFGMVHDIGDLLGKEARIDRVADGTNSHDAVPRLKMTPRIPGQRPDAVANANAAT